MDGKHILIHAESIKIGSFFSRVKEADKGVGVKTKYFIFGYRNTHAICFKFKTHYDDLQVILKFEQMK